VKEVSADNLEHGEVDVLIRRLQPARTLGPSDRPARVGTRPQTVVREIHVPRRPAGVWACVGLGVMLGIALPFWPYPQSCGLWLLLYGSAVWMEVVAGIWGARLTWDTHLGLAHLVALVTILWGLALAAQQVLPRVGYANYHAVWVCR
jgi:hypothetical protein